MIKIAYKFEDGINEVEYPSVWNFIADNGFRVINHIGCRFIYSEEEIDNKILPLPFTIIANTTIMTERRTFTLLTKILKNRVKNGFDELIGFEILEVKND